jgi:hypothetical protein
MLFKSNVDVQFTINSSQVSPEIWSHIDQSLSRDQDWNLVSCVEEVIIEGDRAFSTYTIAFQPPETALIGDVVMGIALLESMGAEFEGLLLTAPPSQGEPPRDALAEQSVEEQIRGYLAMQEANEGKPFVASSTWLDFPYAPVQ